MPRLMKGRCLAACALSVGTGCVGAVRASAPPALYTSAPSFSSSDKIVSTTVFHWFGATDGQQIGPWRPLEGRPAWDGGTPFFKRQIKDIMDANIQVMYVHLMGDPAHEQKRVNLFQAAADLRREGYNVPKIAPFFDVPLSFIPDFGVSVPVDLATPAGKDTFVDQYKRFYNQYWSVNVDVHADDYLARIDNKPVLNVWHLLPEQVANRTSLTRADVQTRLSSAFGPEHPMFNNGIYQVATALNPGIQMPFADERIPQFETNEYIRVVTANSVRAAQLKAGYWDQNLLDREPGSFVPRAGGTHYTSAWNTANNTTNKTLNLRRINVESWNEYDEGSGIYEGDTGPPFISEYNTSGNSDVWSATNNPRQYIDTTAAGAKAFNDIADRDARILWHDFPAKMYAGTTWNASVVVRNEGDNEWTAAQGYKFGQQEFVPLETMFGPGRYLMDDTQDEIPIYGGIFRGRPKLFDVPIVAPTGLGTYNTHWGMLQEHVAWFGQSLTVPIQVAAKINGDANVDGAVTSADIMAVAAHWRTPGGADWPSGDFDSDGDVDRHDRDLLAVSYPGGAAEAQALFDSFVPHWQVNATGDWHEPSNWFGGVRHGIDATATFGSVTDAGRLIFANTDVTLGTLTFNSPHRYALNGLGTLTLQVSGGEALIEVLQGTHDLNLPLGVASDTELYVAPGATLLISDPVNIAAGKTLGQVGGGSVTYQSTISIGAGGTLTLSGPAEAAALNLAAAARIDLRDSLLLRDATQPDVLGMIRDGSIISSPVADDPLQATTLGIAPRAGGVHVMPTWYGDADLSGALDVADFERFLVGYGNSALAEWISGDFDHSGRVDPADFELLVRGLAGQGRGVSGEFSARLARFATAEGLDINLGVVPEPASPAAMAAAALILARRRRSSRIVR